MMCNFWIPSCGGASFSTSIYMRANTHAQKCMHAPMHARLHAHTHALSPQPSACPYTIVRACPFFTGAAQEVGTKPAQRYHFRCPHRAQEADHYVCRPPAFVTPATPPTSIVWGLCPTGFPSQFFFLRLVSAVAAAGPSKDRTAA